MERALLKLEASGPEAIEPDSFGESRRDGPSKLKSVLWHSPQLR
jgi:hypothetical protein